MTIINQTKDAAVNYDNVLVVSQTGCIGVCQYEPIVEVYEAGKEKVTYAKMTADKVAKIVEQHLKGGKVVSEYVLADIK